MKRYVKKFEESYRLNVGDTIQYGSPGYPMDFTITDITRTSRGYEIEGGIRGDDEHFFELSKKDYITLLKNGEVSYTDSQGGYVEVIL